MINLTIEVEVAFCTRIEDAAYHAARLSHLLDVDVAFGFNGMRCVARPDLSAEQVIDAWREAVSHRPSERP